MRNRSVAGSTVTATPASARRRAISARRAGGNAESLVTCPTATRPPYRCARRLPADLVEVHARGVEIEIEMEIDVEIEAPRDGEDARDLPVRVAVGIGTAADQVGARLASRDQQFLGAGVVEQSLLRKHADLEIDRPGVVALEAADGARSLFRPMRGSTSTCVRMRVVPCTIAFSSVRRPRA